MSTRSARLTGAALVAALGLTACGGGGGGGDGEDDDVTLRFAFWGSDTRVQNTEEIIEVFEEEHPHIEVVIEYNDWDGFWDQLATQAAGGEAPDIFQMDAPYLREYGERGALLDLSDVDLSAMPEDIVESGSIDGEYYGLASGVNAVAVVVNPRLFEEAGVEMPDDTTWTWEDFADIATEITESLDGVYGASGPAEPQSLQAWVRQQGVQLTDADGELGVEVQHLEDYLSYVDELRRAGAYPPAEVMVEELTAPQDQSLEASGGAAMAFSWTNLLGALQDAGGEELELLRLPSPTGDVADAQQWYNTGMVSASSSTDHPEEVVEFLDFFVNDLRSAEINMTDRGLSANTEIRPQLMDTMDEANATAAEFMDEIEDELGEPAPVPATGFGQLADVIHRYEAEVFFERMTPAEAAEAMHAEFESTLG
ncbi:ABC transporter substrate-binding protein [Nesterenkonia sp. HG001]|uniref:ABC transporter substrate-binding protein n=1 Tax=Nesterenkonia sp. HG001 TaxID=2983207 RepID=UPI002AC6C95D|nr:extracellular solute-binding protein [Nesterenkonia sp. HG001]MDZ5077225.1 extracellular solute-binding protein [Nesterenkonia sp. HG001]